MQNKSQEAYYKKNKEKILAAQKRRREDFPEKDKEVYRRYYEKKKLEDPTYFTRKSRERYNKNKERYRELAKRSRDKLRAEMIAAYGGKCACCGEAEPVFLTIEHKNRDGKKHRELAGNTPTAVYADLRRRGWPQDDYELLCFNCNRASWVLGVCPHRARKVEANNE